MLEKLQQLSSLVVSQKVELLEALPDFYETRNKYVVLDGAGRMLFLAMEQPAKGMGEWSRRQLLKSWRPFNMLVMTEDAQTVLRIARPFRLYYQRADIFDAKGQRLGAVEKQFSLLRRIYSVSDFSGREKYQLFGPLLKPWTFKIRDNSREYGEIVKKWSGLTKEVWTDADNFGIRFPAQWDVKSKAVFLGAAFLIDYVHFEDSG